MENEPEISIFNTNLIRIDLNTKFGGKMKKENLCVFSLLAVLFLSTATLIIPSVRAYGLAIQYGHIDDRDPPIDTDEQSMESDVCYMIVDYYSGQYPYAAIPMDAYGDYTNEGNVSNMLSWQCTNYDGLDYVTNWWVGDFHNSGYGPPAPFGHYWFYGHVDSQTGDIRDDWVYNDATEQGGLPSRENFDFIWTCANGGRYWMDTSGDFDNVSGIIQTINSTTNPEPTFTPANFNTLYGFFSDYGEVGMPLAWTGRSDMDLYGYYGGSGSYCYIGFEGPSPRMVDELPNSGAPAWLFVSSFYYKGLGYYDWNNPQSVHDSLDQASQVCFGCNFDSTPLYVGHWVDKGGYWWYTTMHVYGNSYISPA